MSTAIRLSKRGWWTLILGLLAVMGVAGLLAVELMRSRDEAIAFAESETRRLAQLLDREIATEVDKIDIVLRDVVAEFSEVMASKEAPASAARINASLARRLSYIPESQSLRIADRQGSFVYDATGILSSASIADRAYFRRHFGAQDPGLVISEPILARITRNWVFTLSRRFTDDQQRFNGIVQAALNAEHLSEILAPLAHNPGDVVTVVDLKRRVVARLPQRPEWLGKPLEMAELDTLLQEERSEQTLRALASPIDGVTRVVTMRRMQAYPFVVIVGRAEATVLSTWNEKAVTNIIGAVVLLAVLIFVVVLWQRRYADAIGLASEMSRLSRREYSRMRAMIDSLPDLAWIKDRSARFRDVNDAYALAAGQARSRILRETNRSVWPPAVADMLDALDTAAYQRGDAVRDEMTLSLADGELHVLEFQQVPVRDESGEIIGLAGTARDVTERKRNEALIRHMAEHDALTDLPNRAALGRHLSGRIEDAGADSGLALMFIDLDHFKNINDSLGHDVGDGLLKQVAARLRAHVRGSDVVSRQGGDEFVVLTGTSVTPVVVAQLAQTLIDALAAPYWVDGHELSVSATIGIALYPTDGTDLATLLKHADAAMYSAKDAGRNTYHFFTPEMNARVNERLVLEGHLRRALDLGEMQMHFQPLIDTHTGRAVGAEALMRWLVPGREPVPPSRFIAVAEESNLILPLGEWGLREACRVGRQMHDAGHEAFVVAVNLSPVQFRNRELFGVVERALRDSGFNPACLELEITENVLMNDSDRVVDVLSELKALGVRLSVDDFGTGFSSLSYLKRFPLDTLKIDQSFVRDLMHDADDRAICEAIIALGAKLKLEILAEGVEQSDQLMFLQKHGCQRAQGFYFAQAMPSDALLAWLHERSVRVA